MTRKQPKEVAEHRNCERKAGESNGEARTPAVSGPWAHSSRIDTKERKVPYLKSKQAQASLNPAFSQLKKANPQERNTSGKRNQEPCAGNGRKTHVLSIQKRTAGLWGSIPRRLKKIK